MPNNAVTYQAVVTEDVKAIALVVTVPVFPAVPGVGVKAGAGKAAVEGVAATVGVLARVHGRRLYSVQLYSLSPHAAILTGCM